MDNHYVKFYGKIEFEVENKTKKHAIQASWKRVAMILMPGDICEYYAWFINRRYNIWLNPPIRQAHITFINDSMKDLSQGYKTEEQINETWNAVKDKWNGKKIEVVLDVSPHFGGQYAWLNVPEEHRIEIQSIREELGLGRPYFGLHATLGYANEKNLPHLEYIHGLIKKGLID